MTDHEYPTISAVQKDIFDHGEVHATFEEHDAEIELRCGTTEFDYEHETISLVADSTVTERFGFDRLVSWYLPEDRRH